MTKIYLWCGPIGLVLVFAGLIMGHLFPLPPPSETASQTAAFYIAHATGIRYGVVIAMCGSGLLAPWCAMVAKAFADVDGLSSPTTWFQLVIGPMLVLELLIPFVFLEVAAFRTDRPPTEIQGWNDACMIPFTGIGFTIILEMGFTAAAILGGHTTLFPRWVGYFNAAAAAFTVPSLFDVVTQHGPFAWNGLLAFWIAFSFAGAWLFITTLVVARTDSGSPGQPDRVMSGSR